MVTLLNFYLLKGDEQNKSQNARLFCKLHLSQYCLFQLHIRILLQHISPLTPVLTFYMQVINNSPHESHMLEYKFRIKNTSKRFVIMMPKMILTMSILTSCDAVNDNVDMV